MPQLLRALATVLCLTFVGSAGLVAAGPSASATSTLLCKGYDGCAKLGMSSAGYKSAAGTMWWRMYSGHNCTNYAAYRMVQSGLPNVRPWTGSGNATNWGAAMSSITDSTPAVGAVAWWAANVRPAGSAGHVAYVEQVVSPDEIIVSQDSWGGDFSWARITRAGGSWPSGFVHFNDVPLENTTAPTVSGPSKVGSVLTASSGTWSETGTTFSYQWRANTKDILGAQGTSLRLTRAHQGKKISVRVTAAKLGFPTTVATSSKTTQVAPGVLASTGAPTVTGEARVDSTLVATAGGWTPEPGSFRYQWTADGRPIPERTPRPSSRAPTRSAEPSRSGSPPPRTATQTSPPSPPPPRLSLRAPSRSPVPPSSAPLSPARP